MSPSAVRGQFNELLERLISASLSVKQFWPSERTGGEGELVIGSIAGTSIALRDIAYEDVYKELDSTEAYHAKLVDGGLLQLQYTFRGTVLSKQRLAYFPSPILPTIEDVPELYEEDELYGDILSRQLVRFPVRFDYAPDDRVDVLHPAAHLTLGQYASCRIPVVGPLGPMTFGMFIVRNFYFRAYRKHKNNFDRKPSAIDPVETISANERLLSHFVPGR